MDIFENLLEEGEIPEEEGGEVPRKKRRNIRSRITQEMLHQSIWRQLINHLNVIDSKSYGGIKFCIRFQVSYAVFKERFGAMLYCREYLSSCSLKPSAAYSPGSWLLYFCVRFSKMPPPSASGFCLTVPTALIRV